MKKVAQENVCLSFWICFCFKYLRAHLVKIKNLLKIYLIKNLYEVKFVKVYLEKNLIKIL